MQEGKEVWWREALDAVLDESMPWEKYKEWIDVFANITKISYTGNVDEKVKGWEIVGKQTPDIGLNMLAYRSREAFKSKALIIAFRGTTSPSDSCADRVLWFPELPLPSKCEKFSPEQLDYVQQAMEFTAKIQEQYEDASIVFTGHSLGSACGEIMSLQSNGTRPAISFASGGAKGPSKRRGFLNKESDLSCLVQIDHPFDPVVRRSMLEQIGYMCTYENIPEPRSCVNCYDFFLECSMCFSQTHRYSNYLHLLSQPTRPRCRIKLSWLPLPNRLEYL